MGVAGVVMIDCDPVEPGSEVLLNLVCTRPRVGPAPGSDVIDRQHGLLHFHWRIQSEAPSRVDASGQRQRRVQT